jgi:raffinose/stachyose/melibiose transport system permease protein
LAGYPIEGIPTGRLAEAFELMLGIRTAVGGDAAIQLEPFSFPIPPVWANITNYGFSRSFDVLVAYMSTAIIVGLTLVIVIPACAAIGYVLSRNRSKSFVLAYLYLLAGLMVPPQVILLPVVQLLARIGSTFTMPGLVLSMNLRSSMARGVFGTFARVVFPLATPATGAVMIFVFLWVWNDFLNPLIILGTRSSFYTVTTGVYRAIGQFNTNWAQVFTLSTLVSLPVIVLYLFKQRSLVAGLTQGSRKG